MARTQGTGRKKIDIRRIENKLHLKTTFTKRRKGLFKKVDEFCTSSGIHAAAFTFSPYGRAYGIGSPSPIQVIERFYAQDAIDVVESCQEFWWQKPAADVQSCEIHNFRVSLSEFKNNLIHRIQEMQRRGEALKNLFV